MIGSIDESGFLMNLFRKGFGKHRCLCEIVGNSIDAKSKNILFKIEPDYIYIIDNGKGMDIENINDMFVMNKSNHENEASIGVSGIGGKIAQLVLSDKTEVHVFTQSDNGNAYHVTVPWDVIYKQGKYTDMISVVDMNNNEKKAFIKERSKFESGNLTGTTIRFKYSDYLKNTILYHYDDKGCLGNEFDEEFNPTIRLGNVFGHFDVDIKVINKDAFKKKSFVLSTKLLKYNYFNNSDDEYYGGKKEYVIQQYKNKINGDNRFICNNMEVVKCGRGYSQTATSVKTNTRQYEYVGDYILTCGCKIDKNIFDINNPSNLYKNYDIPRFCQYFGNEIRYYKMVHLMRNSQYITSFNIHNKITNEDKFVAYAVKAELAYYPLSQNDNLQDKTIGIQENKNQLDNNSLPVNLTRLIHYLKENKAKEIMEGFDKVIKINNKLNVKKNEEEEEDEEDEEEEDEEEKREEFQEEKREEFQEEKREEFQEEKREEFQEEKREELINNNIRYVKIESIKDKKVKNITERINRIQLTMEKYQQIEKLLNIWEKEENNNKIKII